MPQPAHVVLRALRALLGLLQLLLRLAELGQVQRGDLLGVLDLLLVPEIPAGMSSALREGREAAGKVIIIGAQGKHAAAAPSSAVTCREGRDFIWIKIQRCGPKANNEQQQFAFLYR